jgi:hypothetical protein
MRKKRKKERALLNEEQFKRLKKGFSDDVKALNPDIGTQKGGKKTSIVQRSRITETFLEEWEKVEPVIRLVTEHRFHPKRKWRFDYADPISMVAIEYNGGVWSGGRHNTGAGYLRDLEKINSALEMGWVVFQLGTGMVTLDRLSEIAQFMRVRRNYEAASESKDDGLVNDDGPQAGEG